jgi:hypothetical protein
MSVFSELCGSESGFNKQINLLARLGANQIRIIRAIRGCRVSRGLAYDSFPFEFWVVAEVDEQAEFVSGGLEIVVDLRTVLIHQFFDGFQFQNDRVETDEVRFVFLFQRTFLVPQIEFDFRCTWNLQISEFEAEAFLVNRFHEPAAHLVVNFEASADDPVGLFLIDDLDHEIAPENHE